MTIYEIDQAMLDCCDMETGEILDTKRFDDLAMERKAKISNVGAWYKNLKAEAKALEEEADKLIKRKNACVAQMDRLKEYLTQNLGDEKFKDSRVSIYFSKTAPTLKFDDEKEFLTWAVANHPEYVKYADPVLNKAAIKADIESGMEFSHVRLEPSTYICIR